MSLLVDDEVRVNPDYIKKLYFGDMENTSVIKKSKGIIIEVDLQRNIKDSPDRTGQYTYFVEFNDPEKSKYWFLERELLLQ